MAIDAILEAKRAELAERLRRRPLASFRAEVSPSDRDFAAALRQPHPGFILEVKPRSPSEGRLREAHDLDPVLAAYGRHASAVSVLADGPHFGGSLELLGAVRTRLGQPVLCKDFVLDPYQVYEARRHGADAVLLMLSVLDDATYAACAEAAARLRMGVLTEVHTETELRRAAALGAAVIGVNNRDLRTLRVSLDVTERLAPLAPPDALLVAESGVRSPEDVGRLSGLVDGFLVGTTIMKSPDPDRATRELVYGRTKICGLTREADARAAAEAGATHGGLVFAPESPRAVAGARAAVLARAADLGWVGVFVNEEPDRVAARAAAAGLAAVQLHGDETPEEVERVRSAVPNECEVWKAVRVRDTIPHWRDTGADRVLLDAFAPDRRGGTGRRFDWSLLADLADRDRYALSGGLDPDNVARGARLGLGLVDVSSGVEQAPGRKDAELVRRFLRARRGLRRDPTPIGAEAPR